MLRAISDPRELIPVQRAALVMWWLAHGDALSTARVARLLAVSDRGALFLMDDLAGAWDIRRAHGRWAMHSWREPSVSFSGSAGQLRGAFLAWRLARGQEFSTNEAAAALGCSREAARQMLNHLSAVLPIYQRCRGGVWCVLCGGE